MESPANPKLPPLSTSEFEEWVRASAKYPEGLTYPVGGLNAEAGEVQNDLTRMQRKHHRTDIHLSDLDEKTRLKFIDEGGDVLNYLAMLANELGVTLEQMAAYNKAKLTAAMAKGDFYRTEVSA